jgi:hypothetical protein
MFCQKNFFTELEVIDASGFVSIHLVKYSTATTANLFPLAKVAGDQQGRCPIFGVAISEVSVVFLPMVLLGEVKSFDRLHMSGNLLSIPDMCRPIESLSYDF